MSNCYRVKHYTSEQFREARRRLTARDGKPLHSAAEYVAEMVTMRPAGPYGLLTGDFGDKCTVCNGVSDVLCDYPVGEGKTCDRALCEDCTPPITIDTHYCQGHRAEYEAFRDAGGVKDKLENLVPFSRDHRRSRR